MRKRKNRHEGIEKQLEKQKKIRNAQKARYIERYVLLIIVGVMLSILIGTFYQMHYAAILIIVTEFLLLIPLVIKDDMREAAYKIMFDEAEQYIEHMLLSFQQQEKILSALQDTQKLFERDSLLREKIDEAIEYIKNGKVKENLYKEAFDIIEKEYSGSRIKEMHEFMIEVELVGGEFKNTTGLLLEDKRIWYDNVTYLQIQKRMKLKQILGLSIACALICGGMFLLGDIVNHNFQMAKLVSEQVVGTLYLMVMILVMKYAKAKSATNWLKDRSEVKDEKKIKNYEYLVNFNYKKEQMNSIIFAAPFFISIIPIWLFKHNIILTLIPFVIGIFMLFQHRANYEIAYNQAKKDITIEFPKWLQSMLLLIQKNTVQVSLAASYEQAPKYMQSEISNLVNALKTNPNNIDSYVGFYSIFKNEASLSVIRDTMKSLYSISVNGIENSESQLGNIMNSIYRQREISNKLKNEDILLDMENIFKLPILISIPKLMFDLYIILTVVLPSMTSGIVM